MKINIYFVSYRREIIDFLEGKPDLMESDDFVRSRGLSCAVSVINLQDVERGLLTESVLQEKNNIGACIILVERGVEASIRQEIKCAFLTCVYEPPRGYLKNPQNFLSAEILKAVKMINSLTSIVMSASDLKIWRLPLKNFQSVLLENFVGVMTEGIDVNDRGNVHTAIQQHLQSLRELRRPRRKSTYQEKYLVDARRRFFSFGDEVHAQAGTKHPHMPICEALNCFRFGFRITEKNHYNVSMGEGDDTHVDGDFVDCHNSEIFVRPSEQKTHLNMFSNDFF